MPSLERTTKTLSNAATHPHSSPSLCHFSNVASWMGWGQGTELQYWALLPGKPKSGRAKLSQLGTPTTESSCEAIYTGKSCGSQIDGNFVPIKEPMTWREVRLCLGLKIWFFLILVETNFNLKKSFFLEEHRWNILGVLCEHLAMVKYLWVWGLGITFFTTSF